MKKIQILLQKYRLVLLWALGSFVVGLVLIVLVIIPQIFVLNKTRSLVNQTKTKIAAYQTKAQILHELDKDAYKKNLQIALIALPDERDLPAVIDEIQVLLGKDNLQLTSMDFLNTPQAGGDVQSFRIKLEVVGDSSSLRAFINDLKTAPKIVKLSGLDITASKGGLVQNTITLTSYFLPAPTSLGSLDQPVKLLSGEDVDLLDKLGKNVQTIPLITSSPVTISSTPPAPSGGVSRGKSNPFQ